MTASPHFLGLPVRLDDGRTPRAVIFGAGHGSTYPGEDSLGYDLAADAFRTATGVHAAAVVKAFRKGDRALMDAVYAAVPASLVGREQEIEIGPLSGRSNVVFWLEKRGLAATDEIVDRVFAAAKASNRVLTHEQIQRIVDESTVTSR